MNVPLTFDTSGMWIFPNILRKRFVLRMVFLVAALAPASSQAATFTGEFFQSDNGFNNVNQALSVINSTSPTATFQSTAIDYPSGATDTLDSSATLADFLGADAATIIGNGLATLQNSVFRITGLIDLLPGSQQFSVSADDGFRLTIDGEQVTQRNNANTTTRNRNPGEGSVSFELLFFVNTGNAGLTASIDGNIINASPSPIPLPAGLSLSLTALAALGLLKWRRRQVFPLANLTYSSQS